MSKKFYQGFFTPKNKSKCLNTSKIVYRSSWEAQLMLYLDRSTDIVEWASESIVIPYIGLDGKPHRYYPDFLIKILNIKTNKPETFLIEIKPKRETKEPNNNKKDKQKLLTEQLTFATNQLKWEAAKKFCSVRNYKFKILTEKELGISRTTIKPIDLKTVLF